ncbi:MAG TPA: hypothetical protein VN132_14030 [Bdellovibrio sp.]|nr:hypothetical protein [Bdellovibrio sp.]
MKKTASLFLVLLSACSPKRELQRFEWRAGSSHESLKSLENVETSTTPPIQSLQESVELENQTFQGVKIEGSYIKRLMDRKGNVQLVRAAVSVNDKKLESIPLSDFLNHQKTILAELKKAFPFFRQKAPEVVEVIIVPQRGFFQPLWRVVYSDHKGLLWEAKLGNHLQIRSIQRVGSQFHDTMAFVFPKGPKLSNLQQVMLKNLATTPTLANEKLLVTSQADSKITDVEAPLKYSIEDSRFDQVQVFYFLSESLGWLEKNLNFKLPFSLQAEVAVGAPEKTNTAFYYQGKIRLGAGDDQTYSHIAQDPSIVIHESIHAMVEATARLPYEGEGGSLNEAYADFFAASQLDNPNMGDVAYMKGPFRRSLVNDLKLSDKNGGLYHDSGIVSGALWDLRIQFGAEKSRKIALLVLNRLTPASDFADFSAQLKEVLPQVLSDEEVTEASRILEKRGF